MSKILVLSSSLRTNSNSELLSKEFQRGAEDAHNEVTYISLKGKNIQHCIGCLSCQKTGFCVLNDDMKPILDAMKNSDVICFATPIYYYGMSGLMKTILDRSNPLYGSNYTFKDIYAIATCADQDSDALNRFESELDGWIVCFGNTALEGMIRGTGFNDPGSVKKDENKMKEAYALGKSIR